MSGDIVSQEFVEGLGSREQPMFLMERSQVQHAVCLRLSPRVMDGVAWRKTSPSVGHVGCRGPRPPAGSAPGKSRPVRQSQRSEPEFELLEICADQRDHEEDHNQGQQDLRRGCEVLRGSCSLVGLVRCVVGLEETDSHRRHRTQEESDCQRDQRAIATSITPAPSSMPRGMPLSRQMAAVAKRFNRLRPPDKRLTVLRPWSRRSVPWRGSDARRMRVSRGCGCEGNDVDVIPQIQIGLLSRRPPRQYQSESRAPPDTPPIKCH